MVIGRFQTFLENELDIAFSTAEARDHCEVLIEQRKALSQQLRKMQERRNKLAREPSRKVGFCFSFAKFRLRYSN